MFDVERFIAFVYVHGLAIPITVYIFLRYDLYEITGFGRDIVNVFDFIQIMIATGALFFVVLIGVALAMLVPIILVVFLYRIFISEAGSE